MAKKRSKTNSRYKDNPFIQSASQKRENTKVAKLEKNPNIVIPCIELCDATPANIAYLIEHTPRYGRSEFKRLVENTIGAIHQIPHIFGCRGMEDYDLKNIVVHFGRSSAGRNSIGQNLSSRFANSRKNKGHTFGMVFAETTIDASLRYERWGTYLIDYLKHVEGLCISNRTFFSGGSVGSYEPGFLYLTFSIEKTREKLAKKLSNKQIIDGEAYIKKHVVDTHPINVAGTKTSRDAVSGADYFNEYIGDKKTSRDVVDGFVTGLQKANDTSSMGKGNIVYFKPQQ